MEDLASNVKIKRFSSEEEAKQWKQYMEETTGKQFSDIGHSGDTYWCGYSRAGELAAKSITKGGEFYKLRVELTGGYQLGRNWAQCH